MRLVTSASTKKRWATDAQFRKNVTTAASKRMATLNRTEAGRARSRKSMARKKTDPVFEGKRRLAAAKSFAKYNRKFKSAEMKKRWTSEEYRSAMAKTHAKQGLAKCSKIERMVCREVESTGTPFVRQYKIELEPGYSLVDLFIPSLNLCVYVDGHYWHSLPRAQKRDKAINNLLPIMGFTVFRIREKRLQADTRSLLKVLNNA